MRISSLIREEKGLSTLISKEAAQNPHQLARKPFSSLVNEDFLVLALHEGTQISEDKNPH